MKEVILLNLRKIKMAKYYLVIENNMVFSDFGKAKEEFKKWYCERREEEYDNGYEEEKYDKDSIDIKWEKKCSEEKGCYYFATKVTSGDKVLDEMCEEYKSMFYDSDEDPVDFDPQIRVITDEEDYKRCKDMQYKCNPKTIVDELIDTDKVKKFLHGEDFKDEEKNKFMIVLKSKYKFDKLIKPNNAFIIYDDDFRYKEYHKYNGCYVMDRYKEGKKYCIKMVNLLELVKSEDTFSV